MVKIARIGDLPVPLRDLARQIPKDIMLRLPRWEAFLRVSHAQALLGDAECQPPEAAARTRVQGRRVLEAMPVEEFLAETTRLNSELLAAAGREAWDEAGRCYARLCKVQAENPQLPSEVMGLAMPATGDQMAELDRGPSRAAGLLTGAR